MKYLPVLKAKKYDIDSVAELMNAQCTNVIPIFEMPTVEDAWLKLKHVSIQPDKYAYLIARTIENVAKGLSNRPYAIDISSWASDAKCLDGRHIIEHLARQLSLHSPYAGLCLNYGAWEDVEYQKAIKANHSLVNIIRLEQLAIDDSVEDDLFEEKIDNIVRSLKLNRNKCYVLIDFESIYDVDITAKYPAMDRIVRMLVKAGFKRIGVGGGSIPAEVAKFTNTNSTRFLARKELDLFRRLLNIRGVESPCYLDYGIRPPMISSDFFTPHANAKLRYTVSGGYMLQRGEAKSKTSLKVQHPDMAKNVCTSNYYLN